MSLVHEIFSCPTLLVSFGFVFFFPQCCCYCILFPPIYLCTVWVQLKTFVFHLVSLWVLPNWDYGFFPVPLDVWKSEWLEYLEFQPLIV